MVFLTNDPVTSENVHEAMEVQTSISGCLEIVRRAQVAGVSPRAVLDAVSRSAHPYAIMSQLSELLVHDHKLMSTYMDALCGVDLDDWRDGEAQSFVDSFWVHQIEGRIGRRHYRSAFTEIKKASRGYNSRRNYEEACGYDTPPLKLAASHDVVRALIHRLYRAMRADENCAIPEDHSPAVGESLSVTRLMEVNGRSRRCTYRVSGAALVESLRLTRLGAHNTTDQFGSEVLAIAEACK